MQQVNLYQPIFKQQEKVFSAKTLLQAGLVVGAGLAALYAYGLWQTATLDERLQAFEAQREQALGRLEQVSEQFPAPTRDPELERRLERRRAELAAKGRVVAVLEAPAFGNREGFSAPLEAFARRRPEQLWLREVAITRGGSDILLTGSTYRPEQVPRFVQALGGEASLAGVEFRGFVMSRSETHSERIDFVLRTDPGESER